MGEASLKLKQIRDPTDSTLDAGLAQGRRAGGTMEAKIVKYHVLSGYTGKKFVGNSLLFSRSN